MPILTQCSHCRKKFSAPDKAAGKAVKCPNCQKTIRVPSGPTQQAPSKAAKSPHTQPAKGTARKSTPNAPPGPVTAVKPGRQPGWYILAENGEQLGPITKEQLDNLATKGRLGFCQIRQQDWREWKWADDVYPELPASKPENEPEESPSASDGPDSPRLVTCPDCSNQVSRRATKCPHCGCPAAALLQQAPPRLQDGPIPAPPPVPDAAREAALDAALQAVGPKRSRSWSRYAVIGGIVLLLAIVATPIYFVWRTYQQASEVAEQLGLTPSQPKPPAPLPEPEKPGKDILSPDTRLECIDQAADEMAKHIDDYLRQNHSTLSMVNQTKELAQLYQALADNSLDAIPSGGSSTGPYQSQYDTLFTECRDWVRQNAKQESCTTDDVWQTAQQWARDKEAAVLEPLKDILPGLNLTPEQ